MPQAVARLHDGQHLEVRASGSGPSVLLPVRVQPYESGAADLPLLRSWLRSVVDPG